MLDLIFQNSPSFFSLLNGMQFSFLLVFLSQSEGVQRPKSDDIDAVEKLSFLANKFYNDILCEMGGMFSIAKTVDDIHHNPWIGFQSWRAMGKKVHVAPNC